MRTFFAGAPVWVVALGFSVRRQRRRSDSSAGVLSAAQRRAVRRAIVTGTPPQDPALRTQAVALALDELEREIRVRGWTVGLLTIFAVGSAIAAAGGSWWYAASAAFFVAAAVWVARHPAHLRRRIAALESAGDRTTTAPRSN
jgi:hypothetical protein